jgi:hypothetical protein
MIGQASASKGEECLSITAQTVIITQKLNAQQRWKETLFWHGISHGSVRNWPYRKFIYLLPNLLVSGSLLSYASDQSQAKLRADWGIRVW